MCPVDLLNQVREQQFTKLLFTKRSKIFNYDKLGLDYEVLEGSNWVSFIF